MLNTQPTQNEWPTHDVDTLIKNTKLWYEKHNWIIIGTMGHVAEGRIPKYDEVIDNGSQDYFMKLFELSTWKVISKATFEESADFCAFVSPGSTPDVNINAYKCVIMPD